MYFTAYNFFKKDLQMKSRKSKDFNAVNINKIIEFKVLLNVQ